MGRIVKQQNSRPSMGLVSFLCTKDVAMTDFFMHRSNLAVLKPVAVLILAAGASSILNHCRYCNQPISNGLPCKLPGLATTEDLVSGLAEAADRTKVSTNGTATLASLRERPALKTQGFFLLHVDINPSDIETTWLTRSCTCWREKLTRILGKQLRQRPNHIKQSVCKDREEGRGFHFPKGFATLSSERGEGVNIESERLEQPESWNSAEWKLMPSALLRCGINRENGRGVLMDASQVASSGYILFVTCQ